MAALDWSQCPAVESIPGKLSGAWSTGQSSRPYISRFDIPGDQEWSGRISPR